jgi:hypothetical protein
VRLLDDLDDAARTGIDKNRSVVDDCITIFPNTILWRNVVIADATLGKHRAHPYVAFIAIGGPMFFDNIMTEARTFIYAQNSIYAAYNASDCASNDGSDRPSIPPAFPCTTFDAAGYTLSGCRKRDDNGCRQKCRCDYLTKHD